MKTIQCYRCQQVFGLPDDVVASLHANEKTFHCPWGHAQHFKLGPTEAERLAKELATQKQQNAYYRDDATRARERAAAADRSAAAYKGVATRIKKRVGNGVCPCCNRTFGNLAEHMAKQHADFATSELSTPTGKSQ